MREPNLIRSHREVKHQITNTVRAIRLVQVSNIFDMSIQCGAI